MLAPLSTLAADRSPVTVSVSHPHWCGQVTFDPCSARACQFLTGSGGTYRLAGRRLEIAWDSYPAESFLWDGTHYICIGATAAVDGAEPMRGTIVAEVPGTGYTVGLRTLGSDLTVYEQVFIQHEYATPYLPVEAGVIVDLGANIGLASLFFAARYPRATVLALEPDPANFAMLSHNVAGVGGRILSVQGAIWSEDRDLRVLRSDANGVPLGDWGVQVGNVAGAGTIEVAGWSMARLIRDHCLGQIDILKIDIEGAEKELFEAEDLGWLASVEMVMIETHERFRLGCNAAVLKMLDCGFALRPGSGENAVFVRERLARSPDPRRRQVIVTPYFKEDRATLERCIASVRDQTVATDHILVADGHPQDWIDALPVRHIRLDRAHADFGNTPRGIGSLMAISEDYEGIGFLDADNWLEPDHVTRCLEAQAADPSADYVIARWNLRRPDGTILALPFDAGHVDTNCFFFLPGSFHMLPHFSMMHRELSLVGDRVFFMALNGAKLRAATLASPSVNYSCLWPTSYRMAGEEPPPEAKRDIDSSHLVPWLQRQTPRDLEIISRRAGVRFGG